MRTIWVLIVMITLLAAPAAADIPQLLSYQGFLAEDDGSPLADGSYPVEFRIFDAAVDGNLLWQENRTVTLTDGYFEILLGEVTALTLAFDIPYWLEIEFNAEVTFERSPLTSSPYAYRAAVADSLAGGGDGDWTIDGDDIFHLDGNVGIGTDAPIHRLQVAGSALFDEISGEDLDIHTISAPSGELIIYGSDTEIRGSQTEIQNLLNTNTLRVRDGAAAGHVLTSDASGNASWQAAAVPGAPGSDTQLPFNDGGVLAGSEIYYDKTHVSLGVGGAVNPSNRLTVHGQTGISGHLNGTGASFTNSIEVDENLTVAGLSDLNTLSVTGSGNFYAPVEFYHDVEFQELTGLVGETQVQGPLFITGGSAAGQVLTRDASGYGSWQDPPAPAAPGSDTQMIYNDGGVLAGSDIFYDDATGRLGIGLFPQFHLDVASDARIWGQLEASELHSSYLRGDGASLTLEGPTDVMIQSSNIYLNSSLVGVAGLPESGAALRVHGLLKPDSFQMPAGAAAGHVLTSDAGGNASWQEPSTPPAPGSDTQVPFNDGGALAGSGIYYDKTHASVGIGTAANQWFRLNVNGTAHFDNLDVGGGAMFNGLLDAPGGITTGSLSAFTFNLDGSSTAGQVLTATDEHGNGAWQDPPAPAAPGSDRQVPFNDGGALAGSEIYYDKTQGHVGVGGAPDPSHVLSVIGQTRLGGSLNAQAATFTGNVEIEETLRTDGEAELSMLEVMGTSNFWDDAEFQEGVSVSGQTNLEGPLRIAGGSVAGHVLTSDASGNASWQSAPAPTPPGTDGQLFYNDNGDWGDADLYYSDATGQLGVGTTPSYDLDVSGDIHASGQFVGTATNSENLEGNDLGDLDARYVNENQSSSVSSDMLRLDAVQSDHIDDDAVLGRHVQDDQIGMAHMALQYKPQFVSAYGSAIPLWSPAFYSHTSPTITANSYTGQISVSCAGGVHGYVVVRINGSLATYGPTPFSFYMSNNDLYEVAVYPTTQGQHWFVRFEGTYRNSDDRIFGLVEGGRQ